MQADKRRIETANQLRAVPLLAVLDEEALQQLAARAIPRRYGTNQPIFLQGDQGDELFLIAKGSVRIVSESPSGREVTLAVLGQGSFFGDMSLLDGHPRSASAYAAEPCETLMLRRPDFLEVLDRSPASVRRLLAFLSERLRKANEKIQQLALMTVRQRLAAVLVDLAQKEGSADGRGVLLPPTVNHRVLGALLSTSRETVSREAAELRARGLIEQEGRQIRVLDLDGLRALLEQED